MEATPVKSYTGDPVQDYINDLNSEIATTVMNAGMRVASWWKTATLFGLGGAGEAGPALASEVQYLYRGVSAGHPALQAALRGRVVPGNVLGNVTEEAHNLGGVAAQSQFTSWSRSLEIAQKHASKNGVGGVILKVPVGAPPKGASWSWSWSPDVYYESEVLMRGVRDGAMRVR